MLKTAEVQDFRILLSWIFPAALFFSLIEFFIPFSLHLLFRVVQILFYSYAHIRFCFVLSALNNVHVDIHMKKSYSFSKELKLDLRKYSWNAKNEEEAVKVGIKEVRIDSLLLWFLKRIFYLRYLLYQVLV